MRRITIDPITRLEGHGKITIFLNDDGEVANCYFQVPELRGFEQFCVGRPVEELPRITTRICGVCPEAHHMASVKACDAVYHVEPPAAAKKLRELLYSAFYVADHTLHFYALGGPDFVVGPDAPPAERNILGVIRKVGLQTGGKVIELRKRAGRVVALIGGKYIHPMTALPGGMSKPLTREERDEILGHTDYFIEFAKFTLGVIENVVLKNPAYVEMILSDTFTHRTYSMGTVDENNRVNFYDGMLRVVDPEGEELMKFHSRDYLEVLAEHVEPWTYLKFPFLKKVGWKGFVDGKDSGVYRATPLARLNAAEGMATPLAQQEYERMFSTLGGKPVHHTLATHWARVIELIYAAERARELAHDEEILSDKIRNTPAATPDEGVGCVEAPRGTLIHHYITDERGLVQRVNLIVGTTNNHASIAMSIRKAAFGLIRRGVEITDGLLNRIEMAFRAYDPCFACATHSLPGAMPLEVEVIDSDGTRIAHRRRP
ncbi:MAG: Ni/Fe hydrogenase subunit alpha [Bryobacterales bacterium]|nr:Ni/Fe hydrogenase subunit alpha [Bryobacterales bacterium]